MQQPGGGGGGDGPSRVDARFVAGLVCSVLGCLVGIGLLFKLFILDIPDELQDVVYSSMSRATALAYVPVALYLFVPWFVDRYDPEPWWALLGVFLWGALFATGVSGVVNTYGGQLVADVASDPEAGEMYSLAISAPLFEELTKGLAIFGMVVFLRREFDGVVDGIIYGTFVAIGFAATENIIYYARADLADRLRQTDNVLQSVVVLRGVLTPWLHPLFTSMTGIGFGLAREHSAGWAKWAFPFGGYCVAVLLHSWWNGLPAITAKIAGAGAAQLIGLVNLVVGILMALTFFAIVLWLVWRKGQTIKQFLRDEVLIGTMSQQEYDLITSYGGRLRARLSWRGRAGAQFVAAGARLALSKWHTARAMQGSKRTISADFIVPLRQNLARLRHEMIANARR